MFVHVCRKKQFRKGFDFLVDLSFCSMPKSKGPSPKKNKEKLKFVDFETYFEFTIKGIREVHCFLHNVLIEDVLNNQMHPVLHLIIQYYGNLEDIIIQARCIFENLHVYYIDTCPSPVASRNITYLLDLELSKLNITMNWYNSKFCVDAYGNIVIDTTNLLSSTFSLTPMYDLTKNPMDRAYLVTLQENKKPIVLLTTRFSNEERSKYNIFKFDANNENVIGNVFDQVHFPDVHFSGTESNVIHHESVLFEYKK